MFKTTLTAIALTATASAAFAGPACNVPEAQWMKQDDAKARLTAQGYEIYGKDKAGKKVEIYFDPATLAIVKQES